MTKIIEVSNLVKKYRNNKVNSVDGVSFSVDEGEFFAFLGPNGAGKTTTISILTTTLSKTSGSISIAGFDIDKDEKKIRNQIGVIFQNPSLDENLTAEENIRFHVVLYSLYSFAPSFALMPKSYRDRVKELTTLLDIDKDIFKPIKSFSGGMKRKLEIVRSLMHNPRVLFLDEPTSGLDPLSRRTLWEYLKKVRDENKTTIFLTTHYLEEAEGADRVCIINSGKIVSLGTPSQIKRDLVSEYITIDAKDRKNLETEIKKSKQKYSDEGPFKVYISGSEIQSFISELKSTLTQFETHLPTLEDAYLEIIGKNERN